MIRVRAKARVRARDRVAAHDVGAAVHGREQ